MINGDNMAITVCPDCGKLLEIGDNEGEVTWLPCIPLPDAEAKTPSGCRKMTTGETLYKDGNGDEFTADAYKTKWGFDPGPVWQAIKKWQAKNDPKETVVVSSGSKARLKPKF